MSAPHSRRAERRQVRHAYNGSRAGSLFRGGDAKTSSATRRSLGLKVAGGVRIDVYVRCRPVSEMEAAAKDAKVVTVDSAKRVVTIKPPGALKRSGETFQYDATFGPRSTQEDVYKQVAAPVVEQVCRGMNCCVMAYGQTGTGKTFTMAGDVSPAGIAEGRHGLIPRSVQNIFEAGTVTDEFTGDEIARAKVTVSFLEVYNEQLEDLLAAPSAGAGHAPSSVPLKLVDDRENGVVCQNLTEVEVRDVHHVMELLEEAQERSHVSATKLNKQSNRAHRIFTITATYGESAKHRKVGRLTLVDLAGSECVGRSGAVDMMAKEAGTINKSLLTLGRVIQALAANEKHVPYRDSKLTRLLAEALGGVCKTSIIATVSPVASGADESVSTLRYAQSAMDALNIEQLPKARRLELQLKQMVAAYDQLAKESERHVRALQRSVAMAMTERRKFAVENNTLTQKLKVALGENDDLVRRNAELQRSLRLAKADKETLHTVYKEAKTDLSSVVVATDMHQRTIAQLRSQLEHVITERDALLRKERHHFADIKADASKGSDAVTAGSRDGEVAVNRYHTDATRQLADLHERVAKWAEADVSGHLDRYANDTEFVAELTKGLNAVDRALKEAIEQNVAALGHQRRSMEEKIKLELLEARKEQQQMAARVSDMLDSFTRSTEDRLNVAVASSQEWFTNHASDLQEVSASTSTKLVALAKAGAVFHQASEHTEKSSKRETLTRAQGVGASITSAQSNLDLVKKMANQHMSVVVSEVAATAQEIALKCEAGDHVATDVTDLPMEPVERRSIEVIGAKNPTLVPRSLTRPLTISHTPTPSSCTPSETPLSSVLDIAPTPVTMTTVTPEFQAGDGSTELVSPSPRRRAHSNSNADAHSMEAKEAESKQEVSRLHTGEESMSPSDEVLMLNMSVSPLDTDVHLNDISDGDSDSDRDDFDDDGDAAASVVLDTSHVALHNELHVRNSTYIPEEVADMLGEQIPTLNEPVAIPARLRTNLTRGSSFAAPSPQAIHQILRDNLKADASGSPAEYESSPTTSYATRKEQLNKRLAERARERQHRKSQESLGTSVSSKVQSYTSLTGGRFTPSTTTAKTGRSSTPGGRSTPGGPGRSTPKRTTSRSRSRGKARP